MDIVERLKEHATGYEEWRVANPEDGSYVISFSWIESCRPEHEAREWLADHLSRNPDSWVKGYEVRNVMVQGERDLMLLAAADEITRMRNELEREQIRLAACGVVALANTPDSAKEARQMHEDYWSASVADVARMVDEQMRLRDENSGLRKDAERLDWLTFNISGKALRAIGVEWGEYANARAAIDAAMQKGE